MFYLLREIFYGHAPLVNGLFLMNLERDVTHIHSINTNRCKVNNDSPTYMWHCHLGHIGVKRMKKLHADGLLESHDYESFCHVRTMPHGQNDQDSVLRNNGVSNQLIENHTY